MCLNRHKYSEIRAIVSAATAHLYDFSVPAAPETQRFCLNLHSAQSNKGSAHDEMRQH